MLSQLAGGLRGFEIGCWSSRSAGGEAGDYALLDRHNKATPRTMRARPHRTGGHRKTPRRTVGGPQGAGRRDLRRLGKRCGVQCPCRSRSGTNCAITRCRPASASARALIDANIPFEFVTPSDLGMGLAGRYAIVYLPAVLANARIHPAEAAALRPPRWPSRGRHAERVVRRNDGTDVHRSRDAV